MNDTIKNMSVILCEDMAHITSGHYAVRFAELAQGFLDLGCNVHLLTSIGWAHADSFIFDPDKVHSYTKLGKFLFRFSQNHPTWWPFSGTIRNFLLANEARCVAKKIGRNRSTIICISGGMEPLALMVGGGKNDWIIHRFDSKPRRMSGILRSVVYSIKRMKNIKCLVVVSDKITLRAWHAARPEQMTAVVTLAGTTKVSKTDGARTKLEMAEGSSNALLFGDGHNQKLPLTAVEAFSQRPNWNLYIVGKIANVVLDKYSQKKLPSNVICVPGAVSNIDRHLWHSAADVAVLSFERNYHRNSGTLMDAVSYGCRVVVSDESAAAYITRKYQLGTIFPPGDVDGLINALDNLMPLDASMHAKALEDFSNKQIAIDHLKSGGYI